MTSVKAATIPVTIGSCKVEIKIDMIDSDIPFLLSTAAMKKAQIVLNFSHNAIALKGHQIKFSMTSNGPNCLPITKPKLLINNVTETGNQDQINLRVTVLKWNSEIAYTLH